MLAFTIILIWCFIIACACVIGTNQELDKSQKTAVRLTANLNSAITDNMHAHERTKSLISRLHSRQYCAFDDVLKNLPTQSDGYPQQFKIAQRGQLDMAAFIFNTEHCDESVAFTKLAFNAERMYFNGRESTAWSRGGWVLIPERALSR